jgi:hypothetical protein
MKETQPHHKDNIEIVKQVNVKKAFKLQARKLPGDGHSVYEFDTSNYELKKVVPKKVANVNIKGKGEIHNEIQMREGCFYVMALNIKNAVKKVMKELQVPYVTTISE